MLSPYYSSRVQIGVSNLLSRRGTSSFLFQVKFLIGAETNRNFQESVTVFNMVSASQALLLSAFLLVVITYETQGMWLCISSRSIVDRYKIKYTHTTLERHCPKILREIQ
jgi:hypothetical protein